ncbi:hypothetical protein KGMB02408_03180 [Bacteroides faecalis]|uniref:DUF4998 domain-containing protein n=2 Tax=Bacteroides faecalis TaxID=2447885 RepID=A0A401LPG2_9BACE|nr:hypothetical protein KGMB02408_03180 [Bacteroides faecalis]
MKKMRYIIVLLCVSITLFSCTDLVGTFEKFQENGEINYVGKIDSLKVHEGLHKIQFEGFLYYAETATDVIIKWDDQQYTQSLEGYGKTDVLEILLEDLEEDLYVFNVYTVDKNNNRSIVTTLQANVYGDKFIAAQNPVLYTYTSNGTGGFTLMWNEIPTLMQVLLEYTNHDGDKRTVVVPAFTMQTEIADIQPDTQLKITTCVKPNKDALEYISLPPKYENFK